jgi:hypothetical protein
MNTADLQYCRHLYSVTYSAEQCTKHTWTTLAVSDVFITTHILQAFSVLSIAENTMHDSVIAPDQQYKQNTMQVHGHSWTALPGVSHVLDKSQTVHVQQSLPTFSQNKSHV